MSVPLHLSKSRSHAGSTDPDDRLSDYGDTQGKFKQRNLGVLAKRLLVIAVLLVVLDFALRVSLSLWTPPAIVQTGSLVTREGTGSFFTTVARSVGTARGSGDVCDSVSLFTDPKKSAKRHSTPAPKISLIFLTKRPGSYDFLLFSLSKQKLADGTPLHKVLEVICVDELAAYRAQQVYQLANELSVPVVAVVPSKPKSTALGHARYNLYNAINTGLLLARGDIVLFAMDFVWLPEQLIQRVLDFYADRTHALSLLGFPEQQYTMTQEVVPNSDTLSQNNRLTLFEANISRPPHELLRRGKAPTGFFEEGTGRPEEFFEEVSKGTKFGFEKQPLKEFMANFWETVMAVPFSCLEQLNGAEEVFDSGNDSHEMNIWMRCQYLGYNMFLDGSVVLESMWHTNPKDFSNKNVWLRSPSDSVQQQVIIQEMADIAHGNRPVRSEGHDFDLVQWRAHDCANKL